MTREARRLLLEEKIFMKENVHATMLAARILADVAELAGVFTDPDLEEDANILRRLFVISAGRQEAAKLEKALLDLERVITEFSAASKGVS